MPTPTVTALPRDPNSIPAVGVWYPGIGIFPLQCGTPTQDGNGFWSAPVLTAAARSSTNVFTQVSAAQTVSGNSSDLTVSTFAELAIDMNISGVTGTTPTLQFFLDRKGNDGIYYPLWQSTTITAVAVTSASIGTGMAIAQSFGSTVRLRWTIGGTSPSFTFSASIIGK